MKIENINRGISCGNFIHLIPNSQSFDDLKQIENYLVCSGSKDEYLLVGIRNTIANGFELKKKKKNTRRKRK